MNQNDIPLKKYDFIAKIPNFVVSFVSGMDRIEAVGIQGPQAWHFSCSSERSLRELFSLLVNCALF